MVMIIGPPDKAQDTDKGKKSLVVGINYVRQEEASSGARNDAQHLRQHLTGKSW